MGETSSTRVIAFVSVFLCSFVFLAQFAPSFSRAQNVDELKAKITDHSEKIKQLEQEIQKYSQELDVVGQEKQTLKSAISTLDISRKKISTNIELTENKISATDLTIQELEREITIKELEIERGTVAVIETIQAVDVLENTSMLETLLANASLASFWDDIEVLTQVRDGMREEISRLAVAKKEFEDARNRTETEKQKLTRLQKELSGEKKVLDVNRSQKDELLKVTQNKEANYQQLLNEKIAARQQFEAEMRAYEAQLSFALDRTKIPVAGKGVLSWPFEGGYMAECPSFQSVLGNGQCLTQYFGNTQFAMSGAYNGKGHNGIDFRAPSGTKITAALTGTVEGTGNTDAVSGCYSYGKWVLVKHPNGISTLYAHLSVISVSPGQQVLTGDLIGYSGATGYVTGPHLHFSVYASGGVKVQRLGDIPGRPITGCSAATIPVAGLEAYLNPLDYL